MGESVKRLLSFCKLRAVLKYVQGTSKSYKQIQRKPQQTKPNKTQKSKQIKNDNNKPRNLCL